MSEVKCNYLSKAKLMDEVKKRVESQVRVRPQPDEVKNLVNDLFKYFDYFNHLDQYDKFIFDQRISIEDVMIPNELVDFITPASIKRIAGSKICTELLIRSSYDDKELKDLKNLNINDYDNLVSKLRSMFKRDINDNMTKLSDIKLEVSLDSVVDKISYKGKVRDLGDWYIPINVDTDNDFETNYFNNTYDEVVINYLAYLKLS